MSLHSTSDVSESPGHRDVSSSLDPSDEKVGFPENEPGKEPNTDIGLLSEVEHFADGSLSADDIEAVAAHLDDHSLEESLDIIREAIVYHRGDPCLSNAYYEHMKSVVEGPSPAQSEEEWEALAKFDAFLIKDWSIYPEVRAVTGVLGEEEFENYENIRVYLNSIIWSCAGSVLATFFAVRWPNISMLGVAVQILIAYTGRLFEFIPDFSFPVGFGRRCHFGGGKWNYKEQMLATCGMGVGNIAPYSQSVVICMANKYFYGFEGSSSFGFIILLTLSTNAMGFGLAGLYRTFLVYPVRMLWYFVLPGLKLSRTLTMPEVRENVNGWRLRGSEFFWLFSILEFGWYWITDFVFIFLGYFDWVAWIDPTNNDLLSIASVNNGLGVNPVPSFDWSIFLPTPLVTPFFASVVFVAGQAIGMFAIVILFYKNISNTAYLQINTNVLYDNTGEPFQVKNVIYGQDAPDGKKPGNLDPDKYQAYSLPFWSAGALTSYGAFFAFYPALIMYSILNYGDILLYSFKIFAKTIISPRRALLSFDDRFTRAQRKYKEVPEWWYILSLLICIGLGIACVEHYEFTDTPVWTIFFGIGLSAVFMVPSGVLYATTNTQVIINVLYELVIGLAIQGNGTALMVSKAYATNFMAETDSFLTNLKQAHYANLAPRPMFRIQMVNVVANSFVQTGLMVWQVSGQIKDLCDPALVKTNKFTCQEQRVYFNAAVQWGTIGPARVFKGLYPNMKWSFLIGACFPIPFWLVRKFVVSWARKYKWGAPKLGASALRNSHVVRSFLSCEWINSINEVLLLSGAINWAPYNFMYYWPWIPIGFFFQYWLPRYYPKWWGKYNYLLYAAISIGYSYGALIMFFATSYTHTAKISWWGNDTGISLAPQPRLNATEADGGYFGPRKNKFPA